MTYKLPVFKIYIILSLFVALLTGCKPFSVSAVVEPNDAPGARGKSFDVSVNVEPDVMTVLQPSPA